MLPKIKLTLRIHRRYFLSSPNNNLKQEESEGNKNKNLKKRKQKMKRKALRDTLFKILPKIYLKKNY